MSSGTLSPERLRALIRQVRRRGGAARAIGVYAATPYAGPESLQVGAEEFDVESCSSTLAVRTALSEQRDRSLVVVTDQEERELGADVCARLARRKLLRPEPWTLVRDMFQAKEVDRRLLRHAWLADALIRAVPAKGYAPVPLGILDADTAWGAYLREVLGIPEPRPDLRALLRWASRSDHATRLRELPEAVRGEVRARLTETAGEVAAAIVHAAASERGVDVVAVGLVAGVLFAEGAPSDAAIDQALVRLEPWLAGHSLSWQDGRVWADAADALIAEAERLEDTATLDGWFARAEKLLGELRIESFAHRSDILPLGFVQRMEVFGERLRSAASAADTEALQAAETALEVVECHRSARREGGRISRARMALRLARWLSVEDEDLDEGASLAASAEAYQAEGAFVDRARYALSSGDAISALSTAYADVLERAFSRREAENRRFGEALSGWLASGGSGGGLLPIEEVLDRVLAPLATMDRVLLLVMDGMSHAVYRELIESITDLGWVLQGPEDGGPLPPVVAALPSVTNVSRTSLLCGTLTTGAASTERAGFSKHQALVAASRTSVPPVLLHKVDVGDSSAVGLPVEARRKLEDPKQQVVGVVLNAIDDHLAKGDQVEAPWNVGTIGPLRAILETARYARRVVVLTSDHGHVLERGTVLDRYATESARARPAEGEPKDGEVMLEGPRVLSPLGHRLIAPYNETIRYGAKQNGYHGGASPQEVLVPLAVLATADHDVAGWQDAVSLEPSWWEKEEPEVPAAPPRAQTPAVAPSEGLLFETGEEAEPTPTREESEAPALDWVGQLLASPVYAEQRKLAGRMAPENARVRALLLALATRGGKLTRVALARHLELPELRLPGVLRAVQRLLNVDGYAVVQVDEESGSVEVNVALLQAQFGI